MLAAQWALLFALGFLVIVMYRHLGRVFGAGSSSPADEELGPPIGSTATELDYVRSADGSARTFLPGGGQAALLAFVNPSCLSCEQLVAVMNAANKAGDFDGLRVLLLSADPPSYLQTSEAFRTTELELGQVISKATLTAYRAMATPLLVAIDADRIVRAAGSGIDTETVLKFVRACREEQQQYIGASAEPQLVESQEIFLQSDG